ncbi:probable nucleoredoxin 1 [Rhododendron vialii]|uniref:probable nucleoredoxin 1 n=1 Tax=Rhododendron vialii TaxID=182163 RepID=UPI00265F2A3D|nr:probable nucleoredoxin 1 [Rhododendron vialii]
MKGEGDVVAEQSKHDLQSLLFCPDRDFLIRNNGDEVKVDNLKGKKVGLYFSASWCGPCQQFTPNLVEVYNELSPKGDFEIVFVSADKDDEAFKGYFSKMPWLAIPFSDSSTRDRLDESFKVMGIPHLVILDENGKVVTEEGVEFIRDYGVDAYPFTQERIKEIKDEEEKAKREQPLKFFLASRSRDFVISANGNKVSISELEGNTIGLYFAESSYRKCVKFTPKLVEVYEKLKAKGEKFEVVMIPFDDEEESFNQSFEKMPWLSLPYDDKSCVKLARYFEIPTIPQHSLAIIGPDGRTLQSDVVEAIEEHGTETYPFTPEKFLELEEKDKAKWDAQTLESILVRGDLDFVIGKDGHKVPISDLVGKNILLYFSAHWCPPCRAFTPKLVEIYHQIKAKDDAFELIFISSDRDQTSFEEYFSQMPWLAIPFEDDRKEYLDRIFKVQGIPMLVAIGPTGRTVTTEARAVVMSHGSDAYPFTEARLKEIEAENEEMAKGWPKKVKHELHEHELELIHRPEYGCDGCKEGGTVWLFYCEECDFDLHPKCALEENKGTKGDREDDMEEGTKTKEGYVCDGEVCRKA